MGQLKFMQSLTEREHERTSTGSLISELKERMEMENRDYKERIEALESELCQQQTSIYYESAIISTVILTVNGIRIQGYSIQPGVVLILAHQMVYVCLKHKQLVATESHCPWLGIFLIKLLSHKLLNVSPLIRSHKNIMHLLL